MPFAERIISKFRRFNCVDRDGDKCPNLFGEQRYFSLKHKGVEFMCATHARAKGIFLATSLRGRAGYVSFKWLGGGLKRQS